MPDYTFASTDSYVIECLTGCTTPGSATVTGDDTDTISFSGIFTAEVAAGTYIDLTITGFANPDSETVYLAYYQIYQDSTNVYLIDKFDNTGSLSESQSIYDSENASLLGNTVIMITSPSAICRISPPQKVIATRGFGS